MKSGVAGFVCYFESRLIAAGAVAMLSVGCGEQQQAGPPPSVIPTAYVDADGSHESPVRDTLHNPFPHLKFVDGTVSLNDRCPVRKVPLNVRLPGLLVNGRPIGFC